MKTKITFIAVFVLVLAGLSLSVHPSYAFSGHHRGFGEIRHIQWVLAKGGQPLTDAQKTQIKDIMKENWTQLKPTLTQLRTARHALRELILSGNASPSEIEAQVEAMTPLGKTLAEQGALAFNRIIKQVLNDAQRSVLQQFKGPKAL
jgi:Spy/CpxP family protein refolding chaperone